jgi:hypothetical protein
MAWYLLGDQSQGGYRNTHRFTADRAASFISLEHDYWNIWSGGIDFLPHVYNLTTDPDRATDTSHYYRINGYGNHHITSVFALAVSEGDVFEVAFDSTAGDSGSAARVANIEVNTSDGPESYNAT